MLNRLRDTPAPAVSHSSRPRLTPRASTPLARARAQARHLGDILMLLLELAAVLSFISYGIDQVRLRPRWRELNHHTAAPRRR